MDILLNEDSDVELDDRKGLSTVGGRHEVRQSIRVAVTSYFYDYIGSVTAVNAVSKLELEAEKVAENNEYIENLQSVSAERVTGESDEKSGIEITIRYDTNTEIFTFGN